jgi:dihydroorotate dehydrogenase (NAD+) catalytic subunit
MSDPLSVTIGPIRFAHPVINASGTMEIFDLADVFGVGFLEHPPIAAYVPKTVTLYPRAGNASPRILETASGMINAIGLSSEGLEAFVASRLPRLLRLPCPLIISIGGFSIQEYLELASGLRSALDASGPAALESDLDATDSAGAARPLLSPTAGTPAPPPAELPLARTTGVGARGADPPWVQRVGLELNISCPNVHSGCISIGSDARETQAVVAAVREAWPGLLVAKLTPNVTDVAEIAKAAETAGADALALVNTYRGLVLDRTSLKPYLGNVVGGLSGPAIKPLALRAVFDVRKAVEVPLIGMGGAATVEDVLEFIACGATLVAVGSAGFRDPRLGDALVAGLDDALRARGIPTISDLCGCAHRP